MQVLPLQTASFSYIFVSDSALPLPLGNTMCDFAGGWGESMDFVDIVFNVTISLSRWCVCVCWGKKMGGGGGGVDINDNII